MGIEFIPLDDKVLLLMAEKPDVTPGGIVLPDSAKKQPTQGQVRAVGPGRRDRDGKRIPMALMVGETVLVSKYGGTDIEIEGIPHKVLIESEIMGVLKEIKGGGNSEKHPKPSKAGKAK
jgi:chaperonin GroES